LIFWTIFTIEAIMLFFLELIRMKIMTSRNSESDFVCRSESHCTYYLSSVVVTIDDRIANYAKTLVAPWVALTSAYDQIQYIKVS